tara:strand:- start:1241 stop:1507 length:267 start_codon:yes stop_codon:yes gene_type:complete
MKNIYLLLILCLFQSLSFAYDTVQEKTFQLEKREVVDSKEIEFDKESSVSKSDDDEPKARKPSSMEKKRQEAVHWKIQQIIEKRESQY